MQASEAFGDLHKSSSSRVEFLDGIRGLAALMVLLEHVVKDFLASVQPVQYDSKFLAFITDGNFAVAIFFVLSGYVLSISLINRPKNLFNLFISRYLRLAIPILLTSTITYFLMIAGLFFIAGNTYQFTPTISGLLEFSFFDVFINYDIEKSYNPALWTMSTELFGSFILYAFIGLTKEQNRYRLIFALVIASTLLFFQPYLACFFFGYLIMYLNARYFSQENGRVAFLFISAFIAVVALVSLNQSLEDWQKCLLASILIITVSYTSILKRLFNNTFFLFIARISFTLYLIQFTVICTLSAFLATQFRDHGFVSLISANINLAVTLIACILAAYLINPINVYGKIISKKIAVLNRAKKSG